MIHLPTVFVLGAGAHCSYGFPSGEELKAQVVSRVGRIVANRNMHSDYGFYLLVLAGFAKPEEVAPERWKEFAEALGSAGQRSIDAFLNSNRHRLGFNAIGKAAIAQVLLEHEQHLAINNAAAERNKDDWLNYLFGIMTDGVSSAEEFIEKNKVGFVTFNYDRFLEIWLLNRIKNSYVLNDEAARKVLGRIPIRHVYGMLGQFPFDAPHQAHDWVSASQGIRTIFEAEQESDDVASAKGLLREATHMCFLGFGFHPENIALLELGPTVMGCAGKGVVASSRYEITDAEWNRCIRPFGPTTIHKPNFTTIKCRETLRHVPIF